MKRIIVVILIILAGCSQNKSDSNNLNVRLLWYPHAQFAGYIVALQEGFYEEEGLNINLLPAGPDIKSTTTVASGSDDIGIAIPNQIITARSNDVPLTIIAQIFQDSPNRYVLKSENRIDSLQQLSGKKVGLWLGGDEAEFMSMLSSAGMEPNDVQIISQGYSVIPFLEDQYVLSQVTTYNELIQIRNQGYGGDKLQILSPKDYNSAILGDVIFTTENVLENREEALVKFLRASIRGWLYTINNPEETLDIVLDYNPELEEEQQRQTLNAIIDLVLSGQATSQGIGYMNPDTYKNIQRILMESGQISEEVDVSEVYTTDIWNEVSEENKMP